MSNIEAAHLEILAAHQAGIDIDRAERNHTTLLKVEVQVLHWSEPIVTTCW